MAFKPTLICLAVLVLILGAFGTSLAMTIVYWYFPELASFKHHLSGTCRVVACNVTTSICNGFICNIVAFNYVLLNGTIMTPYRSKWVLAYEMPNSAQCPPVNSTIPCYYDDRHIQSTLTLYPFEDYAYGPLTIISLLCVASGFVLIIGLSALAYIMCDDCHDYRRSRSFQAADRSATSNQPSVIELTQTPTPSSPQSTGNTIV